MRMHSHAGKYHARMRLRQCQRSTTRSQVNPGINHAGNSTCHGGRDDGFTVSIETGGINMGMAIDEQINDPFKSSITSLSIVYAEMACQIKLDGTGCGGYNGMAVGRS
jgi:hypothetical protein